VRLRDPVPLGDRWGLDVPRVSDLRRGPFEAIGIRTTVALLVAFFVVCGLEVVTGWLLWRGLRAGAVLAVALLPIELAFWIGFALPLGPPLGLARAILVIRQWSSFRRPSN
jgi:hypothetical protein